MIQDKNIIKLINIFNEYTINGGDIDTSREFIGKLLKWGIEYERLNSNIEYSILDEMIDDGLPRKWLIHQFTAHIVPRGVLTLEMLRMITSAMTTLEPNYHKIPTKQ